jgi:hypothetical protein
LAGCRIAELPINCRIARQFAARPVILADVPGVHAGSGGEAFREWRTDLRRLPKTGIADKLRKLAAG